MSREGKIKAVAAALQPKALDLTQYARARAASRERPTPKVREDVAAGMLGFAIADLNVTTETGEALQLAGDPLAVALLRLKYASQLSMPTFERALDLLLHKHGGVARPASDTAHAVAAAALVEWLNDRCPKCRGPRELALHPDPCPACKPTTPPRDDGEKKPLGNRRLIQVTNAKGQRSERMAALSSPDPGCPKCKGLGRVFSQPDASRGMVCVSCRNSGLITWKPKRRWRLVSELIVEDQRARGFKLMGMKYDTFMAHWQDRYYRFIDLLRYADRRMGAAIDFGLTTERVEIDEPANDPDGETG